MEKCLISHQVANLSHLQITDHRLDQFLSNIKQSVSSCRWAMYQPAKASEVLIVPPSGCSPVLFSCPDDHQRNELTLTSSRQSNWLSDPDVFKGSFSHLVTRLTLHSSTPVGCRGDWVVQTAVRKLRSCKPGMMQLATLLQRLTFWPGD